MRFPRKPRGIHRITDGGLRIVAAQMYEDVSRVLNGRVYLGDPQSQAAGQRANIDGVWPGALKQGYTLQTPASADQEFSVTHNLGRIPTGYDVKGQDAAGIVYDSRRTSWTPQVMYLKCNVASMNLVLFVH